MFWVVDLGRNNSRTICILKVRTCKFVSREMILFVLKLCTLHISELIVWQLYSLKGQYQDRSFLYSTWWRFLLWLFYVNICITKLLFCSMVIFIFVKFPLIHILNVFSFQSCSWVLIALSRATLAFSSWWGPELEWTSSCTYAYCWTQYTHSICSLKKCSIPEVLGKCNTLLYFFYTPNEMLTDRTYSFRHL